MDCEGCAVSNGSGLPYTQATQAAAEEDQRLGEGGSAVTDRAGFLV